MSRILGAAHIVHHKRLLIFQPAVLDPQQRPVRLVAQPVLERVRIVHEHFRDVERGVVVLLAAANLAADVLNVFVLLFGVFLGHFLEELLLFRAEPREKSLEGLVWDLAQLGIQHLLLLEFAALVLFQKHLFVVFRLELDFLALHLLLLFFEQPVSRVFYGRRDRRVLRDLLQSVGDLLVERDHLLLPRTAALVIKSVDQHFSVFGVQQIEDRFADELEKLGIGDLLGDGPLIGLFVDFGEFQPFAFLLDDFFAQDLLARHKLGDFVAGVVFLEPPFRGRQLVGRPQPLKIVLLQIAVFVFDFPAVENRRPRFLIFRPVLLFGLFGEAFLLGLPFASFRLGGRLLLGAVHLEHLVLAQIFVGVLE